MGFFFFFSCALVIVYVRGFFYDLFVIWVFRKLAKGKWACGVNGFVLCIVVVMEVFDELPRSNFLADDKT